jgi:4-amino-4-deoxy-L-arabinose transferase-like glycosyltransferase
VLAALANPTQGYPGSVAFVHGHFTVPLPTDGNVHGWAWFYFINEQVLRYLNLRVPRDYDTVPLWIFLGLILVWLLPWSAFLPSAFVRAGRERKQIDVLLLLWAVIPLAFFCFSTRQEYYVLPALPPMILLVARELEKGNAQRSREGGVLGGLMLLAGVAAAGVSLFFLVHRLRRTPIWPAC